MQTKKTIAGIKITEIIDWSKFIKILPKEKKKR